mmetsp:Transcript_12228/g.15871  ORF Transcript_12228/g.15871 Transcript_12228/m.15871 type:complete len:260 (-) Transcript_12228:300-1079(-)
MASEDERSSEGSGRKLIVLNRQKSAMKTSSSSHSSPKKAQNHGKNTTVEDGEPSMKRAVSWRDDDDEDADVAEVISQENVQVLLSTSGGRRSSYSVSHDDFMKHALKISQEEHQNPTIFTACKKGEMQMFVSYFEDPSTTVDIDAKDDNGWTMLMTASAVGAVDIVQYLIERGAKLNLKDDVGQTALFCACFDGHPAVVELLLVNGANRSLKDDDDILPGQLYSQQVSEDTQERIIHLIRNTVPRRQTAAPKKSCCTVS